MEKVMFIYLCEYLDSIDRSDLSDRAEDIHERDQKAILAYLWECHQEGKLKLQMEALGIAHRVARTAEDSINFSTSPVASRLAGYNLKFEENREAILEFCKKQKV